MTTENKITAEMEKNFNQVRMLAGGPGSGHIADIMADLKGTTIVGITTETNVKLKGGKKNPFQGRVTKRMLSGNCMVFCNQLSNGYENMVKRRLEKEGMNADGFTLGKRVWGNRVINTPFVMHKGQLYLETIFIQKPKGIIYLVDGVETPKDEIEGLPVEKPVEGKQGGLEDKVIIRTFKTDNIKSLRYGGKEYTF